MHQARVDMQRRTNEWYQGLREASSEGEEEEEDVIVELETTFTKQQAPGRPPWRDEGRGGVSYKSPPPPAYNRRGLKKSPQPSPVWSDVNLECSGQENNRSSGGSHSSNSELVFVRDRTASRSPPSGDVTTTSS